MDWYKTGLVEIGGFGIFVYGEFFGFWLDLWFVLFCCLGWDLLILVFSEFGFGDFIDFAVFHAGRVVFGVDIGRDFRGDGSLGSFLVWEDFRKFRKFGVYFDFCWMCYIW